MVFCVVIGSCLAQGGSQAKTNIREKEKQILDKLLGNVYDRRIRPSGANGTGRHPTQYNSNRLHFFFYFLPSLKNCATNCLKGGTTNQYFEQPQKKKKKENEPSKDQQDGGAPTYQWWLLLLLLPPTYCMSLSVVCDCER